MENFTIILPDSWKILHLQGYRLPFANKKSGFRDIRINDRVYVKYVPKAKQGSKLAKSFYGPAIVVEKLTDSKVVILVKATGKKAIVHVNNILVRNDVMEK